MTASDPRYVCAECGRPLPLGGVLSDEQQRVHALCAGLIKRRVQDLASETARRMATGRVPLAPTQGVLR
jgi:DNA-directed RNA polymerase subunit RPC12/RpoP